MTFCYSTYISVDTLRSECCDAEVTRTVDGNGACECDTCGNLCFVYEI